MTKRGILSDMDKQSCWMATAEMPSFPSLSKDVKTDVLIIGGGLAGLLCAYKLGLAGVDCIVVESERVCGGITKNTTAKITSQHGLIYHTLLRRFGKEKTAAYLSANQAALDEYRSLSENIPCDFEEKDSFVYTLKHPRKIEQELSALHAIGFDATYADGLPLPFPTLGAVRFARQAQFHPLKFLAAIAKDLTVYEDTKVLEVFPHGVHTDKSNISAKKIVVATHFPFLNRHGLYFVKMYQHRSYVTAFRNAPSVDGMYLDEDEKGLSFRNYGDLLLLGGGGHRTGGRGGNWQELSAVASVCYPQAEPVYQWAAQDCITLDDIPYIGQYGKTTPNLYVATGFNKWGFTSAMVAANVLTDAVLGQKNAYAEVFSPFRPVWRPRLFGNLFKTTVGLLTPTVPRCPHLGCALKYNKQEHSWDCPCHGSRFTHDKKLIDNPATDDMN